MQIDSYYSLDDRQLSFSRQQASDFAKRVADDFNPLHDVEAKRFCVPGDLLFAVILKKFGLSQNMHFQFSGMVSDSTRLLLPDDDNNEIALKDAAGKLYLTVSSNGELSRDETVISKLIQQYVTFSGQTFPHLIVPLLAAKQVMINPARPIVMYEEMLIALDDCQLHQPTLRGNSKETRVEIDGRRGNAKLAFDVIDNGVVKGRGEKHMLLSGLLPYDEQISSALVDSYTSWKQKYLTAIG